MLAVLDALLVSVPTPAGVTVTVKLVVAPLAMLGIAQVTWLPPDAGLTDTAIMAHGLPAVQVMVAEGDAPAFVLAAPPSPVPSAHQRVWPAPGLEGGKLSQATLAKTISFVAELTVTLALVLAAVAKLVALTGLVGSTPLKVTAPA